ncbi:acyl-coenzyme A thioesterase 8-like [Liolophura sinensis]|uniref:acyl-coenzyme A thioesterase 8-like n=1 Tax=Liolophura sinensis TaxID=3198878 RepID=UPI0031598668
MLAETLKPMQVVTFLSPRVLPSLNRSRGITVRCVTCRQVGMASSLGTEAGKFDPPAAEPDLEGVLHKTLDLETIDVNIYRAKSANLWKPALARFVFGGQIVGQAMVASLMTVPRDRSVHSLHAYFLKGGNPNFPVIYHVERTRDGATYSSRTVKAIQNGDNILAMQVSCKEKEESVLSHQYTMPDVPPPSSLLNTEQILQKAVASSEISEFRKIAFSKLLAQEVPVELRPTEPCVYLRTVPSPPIRYIWVRAKGHIGEDMNMHQCVAAYFSDMALLGTALNPEPKFKVSFMSSLDHSIWFHNSFHVDEWMLLEMESPQAGMGRAFSLGRLWRQDGILAASVAQEGVIRGKL